VLVCANHMSWFDVPALHGFLGGRLLWSFAKAELIKVHPPRPPRPGGARPPAARAAHGSRALGAARAGASPRDVYEERGAHPDLTRLA
jgi:hypothetical protein